MIVVLDASAAVEVVLGMADASKFREVLMRSDVVLAPNTFASEVCNVFWKYHVFSDLSSELCQQHIENCLVLVDDLVDTAAMCREVFNESAKHTHPVYDVFYLVLARRQGAAIITKDKKMRKLAEQMGVNTL